MFAHETYINLGTFKKDLSRINTPVWCARLEDESSTLYVFTNKFSGKIKRIKNNSLAKVCACDFKGKATGEWVEARATISSEHQVYLKVIEACKKKYGWLCSWSRCG